MIYYVRGTAYEIVNGGDNMFMVDGNVVDSIEKAKQVCHFIDSKKREIKRQKDGSLFYCQVAA